MASGLCPVCGVPRQPNMRFCANCGHDYGIAAAPAAKRPSNADIFGFQEVVEGVIDNDRVLVKKRHVRTAWDAAVPPSQSVGFDFYVAQFPFTMTVIGGGGSIGTTARRITSRARRREGPQITSRALASSLGARVGARTVIAARRRPAGPWEPGFDGMDIDPDPPPPPPDSEVPFEITLTPPAGLAPIVYTRPKSSEIRQWPLETARIDPAYLDRGRGKWHISVKNINDTGRRIEIQLQSVHAITPISQQDIPVSLVNFLSEVALQKAAPTIEYVNGDVVVLTPSHFLDLMDVDRTYSLGSVVGRVVESLPTYTPFWAKLMSRDQFIERLEARKAEINAEFVRQIQGAGASSTLTASLNNRRSNAIDACDASIAKLRGMSDNAAAFCLVMEGMFTNPDVDIRYIGTVAEIENQIPQIGLVFNRQLGFTDVISNLAIDLSPLLTKVAIGTAALTLLTGGIVGALVFLGGVKLYNSIDDSDIEEKIRQQIRDRGIAIAGYVKRSVERITDMGAVALDARIEPGAAPDGKDALRVKYFNPSTARPPRPMKYIEGAVAPIEEVFEIGAGDLVPQPRRALINVVVTPTRRGAGSTRRVARDVGVDDEPTVDLNPEPAGALPAGFVVDEPETLARLDDHACIAIVMMENRSYDHFFFDLPTVYPGRGYQKVPSNYTNPPPPGFGEPMLPVRNTAIGLGNNLIFIPGNRSSDPNHNKEHTWFQMGGGTVDSQGTGAMRGFAADFATESDSPQIAMSYFALDDLSVLKALAGRYPVCDRWFAALPVGTYPNRLAMLQGNVPFLRNIKMSDPALGYLEDYNIFDVLNTQGISWKFFESDIGTIRLYDRFRLDVEHVRPIAELDGTLRDASQGGSLPRVMFIEPHFLFGNDDHPPMDVQQGQDFIRQVVGKFIEHGLLDRTLFVITYDEHGGFFDHIAPPGTDVYSRRRPTGIHPFYGPIEALYPREPNLAPTSLGIRVPSLVLSKWTSARANHTFLDHTAILKTLLLHNRAAISTEQFGRFGERVKKRAHLGQVLDRSTPRDIDYSALMNEIAYLPGPMRETARSAVVSAAFARLTPEHPGNVTRGIGLPHPRRIVT